MLDNLELIGTGFAVVMLVLAALWGMSALVSLAFIRAAAAPKPAAPAPAPVVAPGVPPHHLVAIAAAVAETLGAGVRITRVAAPGHKVEGWPMEGRIETFTAHRIRTDWGPTRPTLGGETPDILRGHQP
ncbi:hypothetical protein [Paenirhodobacter hankyongi]|uniref:Oxaloacetate decarboxylase, gamma chain n=1 Tax=Paenirhodobacter hankyongi TaxID=2294033 RepID=A0A421BKV2_9RHOB|nr:hypothetical protein [Sinirhodobacter hankyongi]RLL63670.1 hypothetical protein DYS74_14270 [Sinirhodobacter hankyongi]